MFQVSSRVKRVCSATGMGRNAIEGVAAQTGKKKE
jgi:hypothetical protein